MNKGPVSESGAPCLDDTSTVDICISTHGATERSSLYLQCENNGKASGGVGWDGLHPNSSRINVPSSTGVPR